jgi:hypothetical protein
LRRGPKTTRPRRSAQRPSPMACALVGRSTQQHAARPPRRQEQHDEDSTANSSEGSPSDRRWPWPSGSWSRPFSAARRLRTGPAPTRRPPRGKRKGSRRDAGAGPPLVTFRYRPSGCEKTLRLDSHYIRRYNCARHNIS